MCVSETNICLKIIWHFLELPFCWFLWENNQYETVFVFWICLWLLQIYFVAIQIERKYYCATSLHSILHTGYLKPPPPPSPLNSCMVRLLERMYSINRPVSDGKKWFNVKKYKKFERSAFERKTWILKERYSIKRPRPDESSASTTGWPEFRRQHFRSIKDSIDFSLINLSNFGLWTIFGPQSVFGLGKVWELESLN